MGRISLITEMLLLVLLLFYRVHVRKRLQKELTTKVDERSGGLLRNEQSLRNWVVLFTGRMEGVKREVKLPLSYSKIFVP